MKVVIIGSGVIASEITALSKGTELEIYGIYSINFECGKRLADTVGAIAYHSFEEVIQDKGKYDFIYVAVPHTAHFDYAKQCLENKIPVLVEKPLVTTAKEVEELIKLNQENNSYIAEAMWNFYGTPLNELCKFLKDKEIYDVYLNFSVFKPKTKRNRRIFDKKLGGGALLDLGIYLVTMSYELFGKPIDIKVKSHMKNGIDMMDEITFVYDSFNVHIYTGLYWHIDKLRIKGKKLEVTAKKAHAPNKIKVKYNGKINYIKGDTSYLNEFRLVNFEIKNGYINSTHVNLKDNLEIIKLVEQIESRFPKK